MNNFDIKSAKYVIFILVICLIFGAVVMNAYKYLPNESSNSAEVIAETSIPGDEEESAAVEEEQEQIEKSEVQEEKVEPSRPEFVSEEELPAEAKNESSESVVDENSFEAVVKSAKDLRAEKQFVKAIDKYKEALELADGGEQKALCYEEMSKLYGIVKRYGTALAYAQKAYNTAPSSNRELLIARLYYKLGEVDKANYRIKNILQRDFSLEN